MYQNKINIFSNNNNNTINIIQYHNVGNVVSTTISSVEIGTPPITAAAAAATAAGDSSNTNFVFVVITDVVDSKLINMNGISQSC